MIINHPTHNDPPGSEHGDVGAGHSAELVDPHRLRGVPPTDHRVDDGAVAVSHGAMLIATGVPTDPVEPFPVLPVPELADEARWYAAERDRRPFPTRFDCGPPRPEREGVQLRPASHAKLDVHASTSRPTLDSIRPPCLIWAALDSAAPDRRSSSPSTAPASSPASSRPKSARRYPYTPRR